MLIAQVLWYESGLLWAFAAVAAAVCVWILVAVTLSLHRATPRAPTPQQQEQLRQRYSNGEITLDEYYRRTRGSH